MRTAAAIGGELGAAATVLGRVHRSAARGDARRDGCFDGSAKDESVSEWRVHLWVHSRPTFYVGSRASASVAQRWSARS